MALRAGLHNFSKGELAPELVARSDVAAYSAGVRLARNVRIMKYGGLTKRPGTRFVYEVDDDTKPSRLLPFQFNEDQSYALLMGHGYMRPAALGGMVLETELQVTAIENAVHPIVSAVAHGYAVGDGVFFKNIEGMVELNYGVWSVYTVPDVDHFTLLQDTTSFGVYTGSTGGVVGAPSPPPPPIVVPPTVPPPPEPPVTEFQFDPGDYFYGGAWFP